jgi:ankyrin repeat protein
MNLLLIHTKEEEDTAIQIESILSGLDISFEGFILNSPEDIDINTFTAFFDFSSSEENDNDNVNIPTHVLVVSPLHPQWFDFLAGFAFGSHISILIYRQEAISGISKEFAAFFTFLGTEASLQTYLEVENEVSKKQDAARNIIKAQQNLLKMGVPITVESLAQCVTENRVKEISFFLDAGFSVNSKNSTGVPMLNIAARNGSSDVIRYLISVGVDVNLLAEDRGATALIDSVMAQYEDIADDLIKAGTDLNVKDKNGQTALVVAAGASMEKMVELLLKAGADADIPDSLGASARKYASLFKNEAILSLFNTFAPVKSTP